MADTRTHRPPEEVRQDIEHTLSQLDETVDALADRLSPGHLIDEAWGRLRGGTDEGIGRVVREHPIPVALVGVGLGWLAVEEATGRDSDDGNGRAWEVEGREEAREPRVPISERHATLETDVEWDDEGERAYESDESEPGVRDRVREAAGRAREMASEAGERARDMGERASEKVSEASSEMKRRARRSGERARRGFWETLEENPLALGAVAFGIGLASGVSVPSTETEDRIMGRASDTLEEEARRVGRETAEKAKHVAKDAARAAAQESDRMVDAAAEAAERRAREEGLTSENLKEEAKAARDRTVQQAKEDAERLRRRGPGGTPSGGTG